MGGKLMQGAAQSLNLVAKRSEVQRLRSEAQGVRLVFDPQMLDRLNRDAWLVGRKWIPIRPRLEVKSIK